MDNKTNKHTTPYQYFTKHLHRYNEWVQNILAIHSTCGLIGSQFSKTQTGIYWSGYMQSTLMMLKMQVQKALNGTR